MGQKFNQHKLPIDIVISRQFPNALKAISCATEFGHSKYPEDVDYLNFSRVENGVQKYADACQRHNMEKYSVDSDSGLPHIFHKAWNAMAELEMYLKEEGIDMNEFSENYLKITKN